MKKRFDLNSSLLVLTILSLLSILLIPFSRAYSASPGDFGCTSQANVCIPNPFDNKCSPGYMIDLLGCSKFPFWDCSGKRVDCIPDPKPNTTNCYWEEIPRSGIKRCAPSNNQCQSGYIPDCYKRTSQTECENTQGQCILGIPVGPGPTIPVYDPTCGGFDPETHTGFTGVKTALGCLPTDPQQFVNTALPWSIFLGAGVAFLLGVFGSLMIVLSAGNPEKMQAGKEMITSAIAGVIILVFAVFLLDFIGVKVLKLFSF